MKQTDLEESIFSDDEVPELYFKHSEEADAPSPPHKSQNVFFDEDDHLCVKAISAFWLPQFEIEETVKSTTYIVDGSYDGETFLHDKIKRLIDHDIAECDDNE
ncbi:MAG: hypothetical protein IKD72_03725 [Clostridia bacterium]|nr:hypothetical protein [Clostridia bacterium]